jgi:hypothetical protein
MFSTFGAPALPGAPHARGRRQGSDRSVAVRHRRGRSRANWRFHPRRLRRPAAERACLLRGCVAHLQLPVTHRRFIRTTDLLERLFVDERRRLKTIPNGFGEKPVLKLMFGALIGAAERWRGLRFTEFELRQLAAVRKELDEEYEASINGPARSSQPCVFSKSAP